MSVSAALFHITIVYVIYTASSMLTPVDTFCALLSFLDSITHHSHFLCGKEQLGHCAKHLILCFMHGKKEYNMGLK